MCTPKVLLMHNILTVLQPVCSNLSFGMIMVLGANKLAKKSRRVGNFTRKEICIVAKKREKNKIKGSKADRITNIIIYIFVGLAGIGTLLPFLYVLAGSFATEKELTEKAFFIFPTVISTNAYKYIFETGEIFNGLKTLFILQLLEQPSICSLPRLLLIHWQRPILKEETFS